MSSALKDSVIRYSKVGLCPCFKSLETHGGLVPNPLGVVSVLTAFNFPVAVYGWNFSLSLAAGNATLWKPSPSTPLCAIAVTKIIAQVLEKNGIPGAVSSLVTGGKDVGEAITESKKVDMGT